MVLLKDGGVQVEESDDDVRVFFGDPHFVHFVGMLSPPRPGVADCLQMLEHTHFASNTPRNDLFIMRIIEWGEILWGIVSIPVAEREHMDRIAQVNGLHAVRGSPVMIDAAGPHMFPIDCANLHTLENNRGHPVYSH